MTKPNTNIYFDFEFIDDGQTITPISLGLCTNTPEGTPRRQGHVKQPHELYIEYEFDPARANDWVRKNVFPHLGPGLHSASGVPLGVARPVAAARILAWVAQVCGDTTPRFVGYYPSYDWVLLCQHFGAMTQGPEGWPIMPVCLMQLADDIGVRKGMFPAQPEDAHNALADAKWIRELDGYLHKRWEADAP